MLVIEKHTNLAKKDAGTGDVGFGGLIWSGSQTGEKKKQLSWKGKNTRTGGTRGSCPKMGNTAAKGGEKDQKKKGNTSETLPGGLKSKIARVHTQDKSNTRKKKNWHQKSQGQCQETGRYSLLISGR